MSTILQSKRKNSLSQEQGKPGTWTTLDKERTENLHYLYGESMSTPVLWSTKLVTTWREAMCRERQGLAPNVQREAGASPQRAEGGRG